MKRYIGAIAIMGLFLIAGLSVFFFISQQKAEIARLEEVIEVINENSQGFTKAKEAQGEELAKITRKQENLLVELETANKDLQKVQEALEEIGLEEKDLQDKVDDYKKKLRVEEREKDEKEPTWIIKAKGINVGDVIDGKKMTKVRDINGYVDFGFEGYYLLKGDLMINELGSSFLNLYPYDVKQSKKVFGPTIDYGDIRLSFYAPGINDEEKLKLELGDDLVKSMEGSYSYMMAMKIPVIAVFKDYVGGAKRESEGFNSGELVKILEISTPEYLREK